MNAAIINVRTQPEIKEQAQSIADEMGLSLTTVVNRYLRHFIKTKAITFEVEDDNEIPSERLLSAMKQAKENLKTGNHSPIFDNIEDELKWLHQQGI